jgi:hypothetical protein
MRPARPTCAPRARATWSPRSRPGRPRNQPARPSVEHHVSTTALRLRPGGRRRRRGAAVHGRRRGPAGVRSWPRQWPPGTGTGTGTGMGKRTAQRSAGAVGRSLPPSLPYPCPGATTCCAPRPSTPPLARTRRGPGDHATAQPAAVLLRAPPKKKNPLGVPERVLVRISYFRSLTTNERIHALSQLVF